MPERLIRKAASEMVGDKIFFSSEELIGELAHWFGVSQQSMSYRLVNLRLLDALAIEG